MRWILVAFAYAGAVVGAGFASGQEIYVFFSRHGTAGAWGICLAGAAFFGLGYRALQYGASGVDDFRELLALRYPRHAVKVLEGLAAAFLMGGIVVVGAGAGAAARSLFHVPASVGSFLMLGVIVFVTKRGAAGLLAANAVLVPLLVVVSLSVALGTGGRLSGAGLPHWWLSSLLYVSYNLFTGLLALLGLGRLLSSRRERLLAALLGAGLLVIMALVLHRALLGEGGSIGPLPVLDLARRLGTVWATGYGVALVAALVTTGVAEAFSLGERFGTERLYWLLALWPFTWIGFERLVTDFYPIMGVLSVLIWWPILIRRRSMKGW